MNLLFRLLVAIILSVLSWSSVGSPVAVAASPSAPAAYTYDEHHQSVVLTYTITERGPRDMLILAATYEADGNESCGALARRGATTVSATYGYDDITRFAQSARSCRGAEEQVGGVRPGSAVVHRSGVAAKTADEILPGVKVGWPSRVADNGKGTVWQAPGSPGNANMLRVMEPTERYPNGYVRFYNEHGQPIGLNGKPGPRPDTHIPRNPDGSYELPEGRSP